MKFNYLVFCSFMFMACGADPATDTTGPMDPDNASGCHGSMTDCNETDNHPSTQSMMLVDAGMNHSSDGSTTDTSHPSLDAGHDSEVSMADANDSDTIVINTDSGDYDSGIVVVVVGNPDAGDDALCNDASDDSQVDAGTDALADSSTDSPTDSPTDSSTESDADTHAPVCVYTQGYWKNHPGNWPTSNLLLGNAWYTEGDCLTLFQTMPSGDASLILAHQLMATLLNGGAYDPNVSVVVSLSQAWLATNADVDGLLPYGVYDDNASNQVGVNLANQLDLYNNGLAGTPHCN